ncbi:MAG: GHMP kinase, partial [Chloroflexi bacterium]|nr:GHMP kinase [Chloroflexota bacterium]
MWRCEQPSADLFPDVKRFLDLLNTSNDFFETNAPVYIARAPGRLDVMGGIADYSGSLVLELPLAVATLVAVQQTTEPLITIWSTTASEIGGTPLVTIPLQALCPPDKPLDYAAAHRLLTTNPESIWAAYVAGALVVLQKERHFAFPQGIRMLVHCEVPIGKGISSSAALEVATMQAICALSGSYLDGRDLAM